MTQMEARLRRRRWRKVLAIVAPPVLLLAATTAGGIAHLVGDRSEPSAPSQSCTNPAPVPAGEVGAASHAPGGGGLRVVDKGFTQISASSETVSLGAVLENNSGRLAYRTRILFRVFDQRRRTVTAANGSRFLRVEIPVIFPGERIVTGNRAYVDETASGLPLRVAGFEINLGITRWLPADAGTRPFARVSVEGQRTERSNAVRTGGRVTYTLRSWYCHEVALRGVAMIFRDTAGTILGGDFDHNTVDEQCRPGASRGSAGADQSMPEGIDLTETMVSAYCDISGPTPAPSETDAPIN
jgi:hypothetical protein